MSEVLVIGVGNPFRHDDGVGLVVLDELSRQELPVQIAEEGGDPAGLIARWTGHDRVILVDALSSGDAAAGTVHRLHCCRGQWRVAPPARQASTHGLGVSEAVELGRALDRLPGDLVLFGVETADISQGTGLSRSVAAAVPTVVDLIAAEVAGAEQVAGAEGSER